MYAKSLQALKSLPALTLALCVIACLLPGAVNSQSAVPPLRAINAQRLAKVVPGITKERVKALLGEPWRTVQYNDLDELENEFWEYRGKDAEGPYRIHIEFNPMNIVVIVGKIPEGAVGTQGSPAKN
jgi:hypothetical protein